MRRVQVYDGEGECVLDVGVVNQVNADWLTDFLLALDVGDVYSDEMPRLDRRSAPFVDEDRLRHILWSGHGHGPALYGDDGEMQCAWCGVDYRRDSIVDVWRTALNPPAITRADAP